MSFFHHVADMDALGESSRRQKGLEKDNQGLPAIRTRRASGPVIKRCFKIIWFRYFSEFIKDFADATPLVRLLDNPREKHGIAVDPSSS